MEIQEAVIVFIVGLVFGFVLAKWLINWAMTETINRIADYKKKKDE